MADQLKIFTTLLPGEIFFGNENEKKSFAYRFSCHIRTGVMLEIQGPLRLPLPHFWGRGQWSGGKHGENTV
jgi:hypothetical protein